jgi:hypothetical protein
VTTDAGATYLGSVGSVSPDSIELRDDEGEEVFSGPVDSLARVEVFRGQRTQAGVGLAVGVALGLTFGFVICAGGDTCSLVSTNDTRGEVLALSGAVGLLGGLLVGSRITRDVWADVSTERLRVAVSPSTSGSIAVGIQLGL